MEEMKKENNTDRERPSFEQALISLEGIVLELEKDDVSLERSIELYQKGLNFQRNVLICWNKQN